MKNTIRYAAIMSAAICMISCASDESKTLAVRLDKTSIELVKGESCQLNATVVPDNKDAVIEWFSEDESYVVVDQSGLVTAVALKKDVESADADDENPEAVSVFARFEGGAAECEVTVLPLEPSAIWIHPEQVPLKFGEQILLTVSYEPENVDVKEVEWSTSNAFVAVVEDGVVTTKGYGSCEIIARYGRIEARANVFVMQ